MTRSAKVVIGLGILMSVSLVGACWDDPPTGIDRQIPPATLVLSDTAGPAPSLSTRRTAFSDSTSFETGASYVSLAPGTIPNAMIARIRNRQTGTIVTAPMTSGGLDPVRVDAAAGDTLETTIEVSGAAQTTFVNMVPARRRPTVVRTIPPRRKTDVPLNARMTIIFSEPIDSRTISAASIRLVQGSTSVPVQVHFVDAAGLTIELTPDASLAMGTTYQIVVTQEISDRDGETLEAPFVSEFTTGSTVAVASIATAQTALFTAGNGQLRTFEMSAMLDESGTVTGTFRIFYPGTGGRSAGRVTCFAILDGRTAWVAGIVDDAGNPDGIGYTMGWRVVDNGHPDSGVPDQLSFAHPIGREQEAGTGFCASTPTIDENLVEIALYDLTSGNVVIGGPGDPPPPPPPCCMSRIAFSGAPNGGIRVMNADGFASRVLTTDTDWNPSWSPDGRQIAFERRSNTSEFAGIYVMNADGNGLRRITSWFDGDPAWSPDGRTIAFVRNGGAIYVVNASGGSEATKLADGWQPTWSPDGSRIAFSGLDTRVHVMNADGSGVTALTADSLRGWSPAWSPDGQSIAFQSGGIYVMSADGSNVRRVALAGQTPAWSPDSKMIIYEWFGLNVITADGGALTRRGSGFTPAWSPVGTMPIAPQPFVSIQIAGGDAQTDTVRSTVAQPLQVRLVRDDGTPVAGVRVDWLLPGAGGVRGPSLSTYVMTSDASGIAAVTLTLGSTAGPTTVHASVRNGTARSTGVAFTATAKAGTPKTLWLWGYYQLGIVDSILEYAVHARDSHGSCPECGNLVSGVPITWAVTAGGGTITPTQDTTAIIPTLNAVYPLSRAVHRLGPTEGATTVTATGPTIAGAPSVTVTTTVVTKAVVVQWGGFLPDSVEVPSGRSVGWHWITGGDSDDDHNVTFEDVPTQPTSSPTQRDGQLIRTFTGAPRAIRYRCTLHSTSFADGEVGVVIVR